MGALCTGDDPKLSSRILGSKTNDPLYQNFTTYISQIPNPQYAKLCNSMPILNNQVQKTLLKQTLRENLKNQQIINNCISLPAIIIYEKDAFYFGEWLKGKPHGNGKLFLRNQSYYEGVFKFGQLECRDAIFIQKDGSFIRGQISKSKFNGKAIKKGKDYFYDGQWKNNLPHGYGAQTDGDIYYKGEFVDGLKHDPQGEMKWGNVKKYKGSFEKGYMEGYGVLTDKFSCYKGLFHKGQKKGDGEGYQKTDKGIYRGFFFDGLMHGEGQFESLDKKIYKGKFNKGNFHGIVEYEDGRKSAIFQQKKQSFF